MKKGYVYSIICPISNEIRYIGITTNKLYKRLAGHIREIDKVDTHKTRWLKIVRNECLLDKLKIVLIEECNTEILNEREIYWIDFYKAHDFKLTNSTAGGGGILGYKHTNESKIKIGKRAKEPRKKMSITARKNISNSLIGNKRRLGKKHSESTKLKISKSKLGSIPWNKKKVYQYDKNLNFIKKWESAKYIEKILGYSAGNISSVCNGKRKYANNFIWSYERLEKNS